MFNDRRDGPLRDQVELLGVGGEPGSTPTQRSKVRDADPRYLRLGKSDGAGPNLKGVGAKHDKKWLVEHFADPQAFVKDSVMPKYGALPKEELEAMADYLLTLK